MMFITKMADAQALSICYIKFPQKTEPILERGTLDGEIRKKAVQKIREFWYQKKKKSG